MRCKTGNETHVPQAHGSGGRNSGGEIAETLSAVLLVISSEEELFERTIVRFRTYHKT